MSASRAFNSLSRVLFTSRSRYWFSIGLVWLLSLPGHSTRYLHCPDQAM